MVAVIDTPSAVQPLGAGCSRRVSMTHTQRYAASVDDVFPLLCPVREHEYLPPWAAQIVHLESGFAEQGGVFTTTSPDGGRDVWVISRYEPQRRIQFVRVDALRTIIYDLHVEPDGPAGTRIRWEQELTSLRPEGDEHIAAHTDAEFASMLEGMAQLLEQHLVRGSPARGTPR